MQTRTEQWIFGAAVAVVVLVLIAIVWFRQEPEPDAQPDAPAAEAVAEPEAPEHPVAPPDEQALPGDEPPPPLPPLAESDTPVTAELGSVFGESLGDALASEALIEKFVATIDNLPRDKLAERLRPLGRVPGRFETADGTAADRYTVSPENERRYDYLVSTFVAAPTDQVVALYRRYYPLMQESYESLGYPDAYFNDRMVEVIDHLLATPEPAGIPELVRPHVLFQYADPDLEALSSGQKQMLRLGPGQRADVKDKLREIRAALVEPAADSGG